MLLQVNKITMRVREVIGVKNNNVLTIHIIPSLTFNYSKSTESSSSLLSQIPLFKYVRLIGINPLTDKSLIV